MGSNPIEGFVAGKITRISLERGFKPKEKGIYGQAKI
jgi:hypothetical protein